MRSKQFLMYNHTAAIVLAAGKGTRMMSDIPKVLHHIIDKPMIFYTLDNIKSAGLKRVWIVVNPEVKEVKDKIKAYFPCNFAYQEEQLGTGHALKCGLLNLDKDINQIMVMYGDDSAFYKPQTLKNFLESHQKSGVPISLLTTIWRKENHFGRIERDKDGSFMQLKEYSEYSLTGTKSQEINCGLYVFDCDWLKKHINQLPLSPKGEYYLTDIFNLAIEQSVSINFVNLKDAEEWIGINTPEELALANQQMAKRLGESQI